MTSKPLDPCGSINLIAKGMIMAWRPNEQLIEGELDNTTPGRVTGWMNFAGLDGTVRLDLAGDFHRDIRGAKIRLHGPGVASGDYMEDFSLQQQGKVGDMTAGQPPHDYGKQTYFEWYGEDNGRVVIECPTVQILTPPIPWIESDPVSRDEQEKLMNDFMGEVMGQLGGTPEDESE